MTKAKTQKRIIAFIIDFFIVAIIQSILLLLVLFDNFSENNNPEIMVFRLLLVTGISSSLLFLKDIFNGASIGKRCLKLVVRNVNEPEKIPNILQLIFRNITYIIWFIYFGRYLLKEDKKKLGDIWVQTDVFQKN